MPQRSSNKNLVVGISLIALVICLSTAGYMAAGWRFSDALYMVVITIFTVGYGEVHPVDTTWLHFVTISLIVLGCTGMIFLTGALVQFLTAVELQRILGTKRMKNEIEQLKAHVIVCGFGRIGIARIAHAPQQHVHEEAEARTCPFGRPTSRVHCSQHDISFQAPQNLWPIEVAVALRKHLEVVIFGPIPCHRADLLGSAIA